MNSSYKNWRHAPFVKQHWRPNINEKNYFGIVIPTYNRPEDLKEALDSLIEQTFPNWIAVVVNDTSTMDYSHIEKSYPDKRITFLRRKLNGGINAARNTGIEFLLQKRVAYLSFLDDDDAFATDFFEKSISVIEKYPDYGWYMSNNFGERKKSQQDITSICEIDWIDDYIYKKFRGDKAHLFSASILKDIRMDERYRASNRWRFFIDLNEKTKILAYPNPSIRKRYQEGGITKGTQGQYKGPKTLLEVRSRFEKHWYAIRKRPLKGAAYRYLILELIKTPRRLIQLRKHNRERRDACPE
jgi:glycosyltransferase involved in cell wall biosynthesis